MVARTSEKLPVNDRSSDPGSPSDLVASIGVTGLGGAARGSGRGSERGDAVGDGSGDDASGPDRSPAAASRDELREYVKGMWASCVCPLIKDMNASINAVGSTRWFAGGCC